MANNATLDSDFGLISDLVHKTSETAPDRAIFITDADQCSYGQAADLMDRIAAALQRDGLAQGSAIAVCAAPSIAYAIVFLGALQAGVVVSPLAPSSTPQQLADMVRDCGARLLFLDKTTAERMSGVDDPAVIRIALDGSDAGSALADWLAPEGAKPRAVSIAPGDPFNIIYSSGTTGVPKGIVQSHAMRWEHVRRAARFRYDESAITLLATPLYSNTTLVSFFPTLAAGGAVAIMEKFDAAHYLEMAASLRATHTMLVPVQYQRIMARPDFDSYDLSSFRIKFCTSAPFSMALKRDILARWPGGLVEFYGMTEGGGSCVLAAHEFLDKLDTVGRPAEGHDVRLINEEGVEAGVGEIGEIVGASSAIMTGYHNQPFKTRDSQWVAPDGRIFMRTGDIGRFDSDGFLKLMDRAKDMIISGGFNIYPSDLEAFLAAHPAVQECAVVGVASADWGETPVAFAALRPGMNASSEDLRAFANASLGKTQRISKVELVESLPRSAIGKILKRDLRDNFERKATVSV